MCYFHSPNAAGLCPSCQSSKREVTTQKCLEDWLIELCHPIRTKVKTNHHSLAYVFPSIASAIGHTDNISFDFMSTERCSTYAHEVNLHWAMTFSSLPLYIQSPWTVSISLCQVSCCPRQWCSSSWLFDANSTVSPWFKLRDPENVCLVNIDRVGQLSSGKSHLSALCSIVHFFSFFLQILSSLES